MKNFTWIVKEFGEYVSYAQLYYYLESDPTFELNKNVARLFILVDKKYRRKKIGLTLFSKAIEKSKMDNIKTVMCNTSSLEGWNFLTSLGGKIVLNTSESYLEMEKVNWELIDYLKTDGYKNNPGVRIENFNIIPEEILEKYVELESKVLSILPLGGLPVQEKTSKETVRENEKQCFENKVEILYKIAIDQKENFLGFTYIYFNPETPEVIDQRLTGVPKEYQGRKLGRFLKADMVLEIRNRFPTVKKIYTANADFNEPILKINRELGFKLINTWKHFEFKI
jgi:GNAT superfamily N-acetyltransferase